MFDMDGTLLYSMRYWRLTAIELLLGRGIIPTPEQMARVFTSSSRALCREALLEHGVDLDDMQILRELESYMLHHYRQDVKAKPLVGEYLDGLRRAGIPMCIATAAPKEYADEALTRLGLRDYFLFITDCYEQNLRKDKPEFFHRMADQLGVRPQEMCVFEDALYSIQGAKAAGCPVIAIQDETQRHLWPQIQETADVFVSGYHELM